MGVAILRAVVISLFILQFLLLASLLVASSFAAPQAGVCPGTGLPWNADANTVDANVRIEEKLKHKIRTYSLQNNCITFSKNITL